jgi:hypothetical protein
MRDALVMLSSILSRLNEETSFHGFTDGARASRLE